MTDYDEFGNVIVLKTVNLKNDYIDYENALRVSQEFFETYPAAHVRKGDILVASTGYVSMGKVDVYDRDEPAIVDTHISIVRLNESYDPWFVAYFLRSHLGQLQFEKWFTGSSGQIEIQPQDLGRFILPASLREGIPLSEQKRITSEITQHLEVARTVEQQAKLKWLEAKEKFEEMIVRRGTDG